MSACPTSLSLTESALFLDLDGTLTALRARPADVRGGARLQSLLLNASEQLCGRVAIISGRTIEQVDAIVGSACLCVAGVHGLQRRNAMADVCAWSPHPRVAHAAELMKVFAESRRGLLLEHKGQSVALHYRNAPESEEAVIELAQRLADTSELELQHGHCVVELKTPGADKGTAMRAFLYEPPFRGSRPIFIGDDLTDEAGFREARAQGGFGLLVGAQRETAAVARISSPAAVLAWVAMGLKAKRFDARGLPWVG